LDKLAQRAIALVQAVYDIYRLLGTRSGKSLE
jgi:hypothetical protein